jgi:hypothetical protein
MLDAITRALAGIIAVMVNYWEAGRLAVALGDWATAAVLLGEAVATLGLYAMVVLVEGGIIFVVLWTIVTSILEDFGSD